MLASDGDFVNEEEAMFTNVHHVTYVVESVEQMAQYLETNFGLKPERTDDFWEGGYKAIVYRIGPTVVDFAEPTRDDTAYARQLKESGPGVNHVAWAVEGIDQVFQHLEAKGNEFMKGPSPSPYGYTTVNIATSSSHGIRFQLAEG